MSDFFNSLLISPSIVQTLLLLTLTICLGLLCSSYLKVGKFGLGVTWILFAGILLSAFGLQVQPTVSGFVKDFGLILFVYSIGLQVGPSFFSSFDKGGLQLNMLAMSIVLLGCFMAWGIHALTGEDMATMIGVMAGAVTNTPALGAAQQAFLDSFGKAAPDIATGYAVAYPLGVLGIILSIAVVKWVNHIKLKDEEAKVLAAAGQQSQPVCIDIHIENESLPESLTIAGLKTFCPVDFIVSRVIHEDSTDEIVDAKTIINRGDIIRVLTDPDHRPILSLLGKVSEKKMEENITGGHLVSRKIVVTQERWNGRKIGQLDMRTKNRVTITRVNRAGINLLATDDLVLQIADRIVVVGEEQDVQRVAGMFGNELKKLDSPNLLPIFLGIALGIIFGMIPLPIPGMTQRFKLGLAGGSLIAAILIGRFGPYYRLVTFATTSANRMLREVGLCLFLASVGLGAGGNFVETIVNGGYWWVLYGFLITTIPLLIVGIVAYKVFHVNYFSIAGMMSGAMTDPPALAYSSALSSTNDQVNVAYATVYPLTMFLRVMTAQLMILFLC